MTSTMSFCLLQGQLCCNSGNTNSLNFCVCYYASNLLNVLSLNVLAACDQIGISNSFFYLNSVSLFQVIFQEYTNHSAFDTPVCADANSKMRIDLSRRLLKNYSNFTLHVYTDKENVLGKNRVSQK